MMQHCSSAKHGKAPENVEAKLLDKKGSWSPFQSKGIKLEDLIPLKWAHIQQESNQSIV